MRHSFASHHSADPGKRHRRDAQFSVFLCVCGLLASAGCGERLVEVRGKATVDGKPLTTKAATILFARQGQSDQETPLRRAR